MAAGAGAGGAAPGVLRLYSCNTQGAGNVGYVVGEIKKSDVVMLQESGTPGFASALAPVPGLPNVLQGQVNFGTRNRDATFHVVHHQNGRCSQTVLVRADIAPGGVMPGLILPPGGLAGGLRPVVTATTGVVTFGSVHAPSGVPAAATAVAGNQLSQLDAIGGQYLVAGDFNSSAAAQTIAGVRTGYEPPGATHQAGGSLDGAVSSIGIAGNLQNSANRGSDHFGVTGTFV